MKIRQPSITQFQRTVWKYYKDHGRDLPWRRNITPYKVFVSEIMLQQTQVPRVIEKYKEFIRHLPSFTALARASDRTVLTLWSGLGYNRRALNFKRAAEIIVDQYRGRLPKSAEELIQLPGVGQGTTGSLLAFAHNIPVSFIETNIRSVYIHHFFSDTRKVSDREIMPIIEAALDTENPREWYYALMDMGVTLKREHPELNEKSVHHKKQSPFKGSNREVRAAIVRFVTTHSPTTVRKLHSALPFTKEAIERNIKTLQREGFFSIENNIITMSR